jgi:uncharacterized protein involved in outer membrane biogenesis
MFKFIKIVFYTCISLIFLAVIGLSAIVLLVNPNNFKDTLSDQFYSKTGQKLVIRGNLSWRLFPWLGLRIHDVQLNNPKGFPQTPLATLQEADLSLKLLPLLDRKVILGTITLNGLTIHLIKNSDGSSNWQNFSSAAKNHATNITYKPSTPSSPIAFSIANIALTHVNIFFTDNAKNQTLTLTNFNFRSHNLIFGKKPPFTFSTSSATPFAELRKLNCNGQININDLTFKKFHAHNVAMHLLAKDGIISFTPVTADLYQGNYAGSIYVDVRHATPHYAVQGTLSHLQMVSLFNTIANTQHFQLTGDANAQTNLTTAGIRANQILENLSGNLKFSLTNGVLKGIDVSHQLEVAATLFKKQVTTMADSTHQTAFNALTGTIIFNNGIAANNDLSMQAPVLQASGAGQVNLLTQAINYELMVQSPNSSIHAINELQQFLGGAIPIRITGNYNHPQIYPDEKVIAKATIKYLVKKNTTKIVGTLDKKFNGLGSMLQKQLGNLLR